MVHVDSNTRQGTQLTLEDDNVSERQGKRVVRNGSPSNDLVLSAYAAANDDVFPKILDYT